jgi:CRISPR system Cascade subunit CasD
MPDRYLAMWLEAPLQSWGFDSRFYRRDTLDFPTRSGILGLLCCAKGAGGEQTEWLAKMQSHGQTVFAFRKSTEDGRGCLRTGRLRDFHMVGSGYDEKDPWQNQLIPKTSDKKKPNGPGTKITYRYYLQDAAFGVILDLPEDEAAAAAQALQAPVWDLYLGRKCCVPTDFIYRGTFGTFEEARTALSKLANDKDLKLAFTVIEGDHPEKGEVSTLTDVPVRFGPHKEYRDRKITVIPVSDEGTKGQ